MLEANPADQPRKTEKRGWSMISRQIAVPEFAHSLAKSMGQALDKDIGEVSGMAIQAMYDSLPPDVRKAIEVLRAARDPNYLS